MKQLLNQYFKGARHNMPQGNMKEGKQDVEKRKFSVTCKQNF